MSNDIFYSGLVSEEDKRRAKASAVYPLACKLAEAYGLRVSEVSADPLRDVTGTGISLCNEAGWPMLRLRVGNIKRGNRDMGDGVYMDIAEESATGNMGQYMKSVKPMYMLSRMAKDGTTQRETFEKLQKRIDRAGVTEIESMAEDFAETSSQEKINSSWSLSPSDQIALMKVYSDKLAKADVDSATAARIATALECVESRNDATAIVRSEIDEMFAREKWIVIKLNNRTDVIVGALNTSWVVPSAIGRIKGRTTSTSRNVDYSKVAFTIPFRRFKSLDAIDPAYREDVMVSLAMAKLAREGMNGAYETEQGFFPVTQGNGYKSWLHAGMSTFRWGRSGHIFLLVDKM